MAEAFCYLDSLCVPLQYLSKFSTNFCMIRCNFPYSCCFFLARFGILSLVWHLFYTVPAEKDWLRKLLSIQ